MWDFDWDLWFVFNLWWGSYIFMGFCSFFDDAFGVTAQITRVSYFFSTAKKSMQKMPLLRRALFGV